MTIDELKHTAEVGSFHELRKALLTAIAHLEKVREIVELMQRPMNDEKDENA